MMSAAEHMAEVKRMSDAQREAIERSLLIKMAERYGMVKENFRAKQRKRQRAAITRALGRRCYDENGAQTGKASGGGGHGRRAGRVGGGARRAGAVRRRSV